MALYCFTENPRDVFAEGIARGWLAALQEFPHKKSREESNASALQEANALQAEVCCITSLKAYRRMFITAYASGYACAYQDDKGAEVSEREMSERAIIPFVLAVKQMSPDKALAAVRSGILSKEMQDFVEDAFTRYKIAITQPM